MKPTKKKRAVEPMDIEQVIAVQEYRKQKVDAAINARENPLLPVLTAAECGKLDALARAIESFYEICYESRDEEVLRVAVALWPLVDSLGDLLSPIQDRVDAAVRQANGSSSGKAVA
jgi:hypothetical protein